MALKQSASLLPKDSEPFWLRGDRPLAGYRSQKSLPATADVVIIGAGLTGGSAAYHLADATRAGKQRVVVLDQGDPASEASGRNGGNFELLPENSVGAYEGLAKERLDFLRRVYRGLPIEILRAESERQASLVLGIALKNRELLKSTILREQIDCDFAPRGWLHLACSDEEERAICDEVTLAARHGQRIEIWARSRIREEIGIDSAFLARFIPDDGTYHPFKYTCGLLQCALNAGVELYSRVRVIGVVSRGADQHRITTDQGPLIARRVIVATNAFTRHLFPQLQGIRAFQSQIMVTENAPDRTRGRVLTCNQGPMFVNQPRVGAHNGSAPLLLGGGADRPMQNPWSRRRSPRVHRRLLELRDRFYPELRGRPASAEWVGAMGFTPDQLPAIGMLRPGVVIAVGYNGYGGSYTTAAGLAAAELALNGGTLDWVPEDVFSPRRLNSEQPLFMTHKDSLRRIAVSLCQQLRVVNKQIAETISLNGSHALYVRRRIRNHAPVQSIPRLKSRQPIRADILRAFPEFRDFTQAELKRLAQVVRRRDCRRGRVLFDEGSPGRSCFIVVSGVVAVTIQVRGQPLLMAELPPGSVFGQVSVLDGKPRSTSCTVVQDATLAEVDQDSCARFLQGRSEIALKVFGLLNDGLISALRGADRQLMQLNGTVVS
ncbi:MAG: FAD-dependent oxidoreductase [Gemmatimonadota bacterium]